MRKPTSFNLPRKSIDIKLTTIQFQLNHLYQNQILRRWRFISNVKILVNTLGHKVSETKKPQSGRNQKARFTSRRPEVCKRRANILMRFVVFEGSEIANSTVPSITKSIDDRRKNRIVNSSSVVNKDGRLFLQEDYVFSSPSAAACLVLGQCKWAY